MKRNYSRVVLGALFLLLFAGVTHGSGARHGIVTAIAPIENRGDDEPAIAQKKRIVGHYLGGMAELKFIGTKLGGFIAPAAPAVGEALAKRIGSQGPTSHYMVKVRLDNKKQISLTQRGEQVDGLEVGSRVRVEGTGSSAQISAE
jgi:outer membrane lipoprotein SlyB